MKKFQSASFGIPSETRIMRGFSIKPYILFVSSDMSNNDTMSESHNTYITLILTFLSILWSTSIEIVEFKEKKAKI